MQWPGNSFVYLTEVMNPGLPLEF